MCVSWTLRVSPAPFDRHCSTASLVPQSDNQCADDDPHSRPTDCIDGSWRRWSGKSPPSGPGAAEAREPSGVAVCADICPLIPRHCHDFLRRQPTGHAEQHPLSMKRCLTMIISGLFAAKKTPSIMDANLHAPCRWCDVRRYNLRLHRSGTSADQEGWPQIKSADRCRDMLNQSHLRVLGPNGYRV